MSTKMRVRLLAFVMLIGSLASPSQAYTPSGWIWMNYPYCYDQTYNDWHYINEADPCWVYSTATASWYTLGNSVLGEPNWSYWQWPWVYCSANGGWYYFYLDGTTWVVNMSSSQWTTLGSVETHAGAVQFTLTWDQPVDLDLHVVDPATEEIYYMHKQSASGGKLDVDDIDGYGPENVYWPYGGAPHGIYQPSIYYFSSSGFSGTVRYVLTIKRQGYPDQTFTGDFIASQVGLSDLSPSYSY